MVHRSNYHTLLTRGRKAGLTTRELNSALASQPVLGEEQNQTDCNGMVWTINEHGQRVFRLATSEPSQS